MKVQIIPAGQENQLLAVAALAKEIWNEYYPPILGQAQVDYMVENLQSPEAIREQAQKEGYRYFLLRTDGGDVGYLGFKIEGDRLFLSKLYLKSSARGKGIVPEAVAFLEGLCRDEGLSRVWLTVNKNNARAIAAYEKMGFCKAREQTADIGGGFVMDDYIMEKAVPAAKS